MKMKIEFGKLTVFEAKMGRFMGRFSPAERELIQKGGEMLHQAIIKHASGRPGPNVITGAYVNSWKIRAGRFGGGVTVYSQHPAGMRLEYGFVGTDSRGRNYNQPPFPHVRPAVLEVQPQFTEMYRQLPLEVWNNL